MIESTHCETRSPTVIYTICFLIFVGLVFRWTSLDLRALHHDESIHVMFGRYFFDWPNTNYYKYNPEYHGPLLYNLLRLVYETFGDYEISARGLIAFLGSFLLFLPWLMRKYFDDLVLIGLTAFICLSPTMIYWSRFVREDIFVITGMAMMLWGVVQARSSMKSFWVMLGIVFQYASKENSYVTMALFWFFFAADWSVRKFYDNRKEPFPISFLAPIPFALVIALHLGMKVEGDAILVEPSGGRIFMDVAALLGGVCVFIDCIRNSWRQQESEASFISKMFKHISNNRVSFFTAFGLASFLFVYLFSAGFRYPEGILDGLYFKGITYWIEKHNVERIKGPFLFHFYELSWYEFCFMAVVFWHAIYFYRRSIKSIQYLALGAITAAIIVGIANKPSVEQAWIEPTWFLWKKLKAKDWFDIFGAILMIVHPFLVTAQHWVKKEWKLAFWGYAFTISFLTYSYLGEKVPWLSSYPLLMGWIYLSLYIQSERDQGRCTILDDDFSVAKIIEWIGWIMLVLGIVFICEDMARFRYIYPGTAFSISTVLSNHQLLLMLGLMSVGIGFIDSKFEIAPKYPLGVICFVAASIFTIRIAYFANFEFKFRELGYISQVHTTQESMKLAQKIREEILVNPSESRPSVLVEGDGVWPLTWYFRDLPTYKFSATAEEKNNFTYIFQNENEPVPEGYKKSIIKLRGWWVPDLRQMTLERFLTISFNHRVWGGMGYSNIAFLSKD